MAMKVANRFTFSLFARNLNRSHSPLYYQNRLNSTLSFREIVPLQPLVQNVATPETSNLSGAGARLYNQLLGYENPLEMFNLLKVVKNAKHLSQEHIELTMSRLAGENYTEQVEELKELLEEKNLQMGVASYNNLFASLFHSEGSSTGSKVLSLLDEMKEKKIELKESSYQILIPGLASCDSEYSSTVLSLLKEMQAKGFSVNKELIFQTLVPLAESNQLEQVESLVEIAKPVVGNNASVYNIAIRMFLNQANTSKIDDILQQMDTNNIQRDNVTWSLLIEAFKNDPEKMKSLIADMETEGVEFDRNISSSLVTFHIAQNNPQKAEEFLQNMLDSDVLPMDFAFVGLLNFYSEKRDVKRAQKIFDVMKENGVGLSVDHFYKLGNAYVEVGAFGVWENLIQEMQDIGMSKTLEYYHIQIRRLMYDGDVPISEAERVLSVMKAEGVLPTLQTYSEIIDGYCVVGELSSAHKLFDLMKSEGIEPNSAVYASLIAGYAKHGNLKDAAPLLHHYSTRENQEFLAAERKKATKE